MDMVRERESVRFPTSYLGPICDISLYAHVLKASVSDFIPDLYVSLLRKKV